MFTARVTFTFADPEVDIEAADALVSAWFNNGQVVSREAVETFVEGGLMVQFNLPEEDALDAEHDSPVGTKARKLAPQHQVEIVGKARGRVATCTCEEREALYLWGSFQHSSQPVRCWTCRGAVPLYQLPCPGEDVRIEGVRLYKDDDHSSVLNWANTLQALDAIHIETSFGDAFAIDQLQTWHPVDEEGELGAANFGELTRWVAESLEEACGIHVYRPLLRLSDELRQAPPTWPCPSCGERWDLPDFGREWIRFRCEPCRLIA